MFIILHTIQIHIWAVVLRFIIIRGGSMDRRKHDRVSVNYLLADISDGRGVFSGTVSDLSRVGLKLADVPKRLDKQTKNLWIILSSRGKNFKMKVRPRWSYNKSIAQNIGMEIVKAPLGWTEFVMDMEPPVKKQLEEITL